jgi:GNAT superfamily N-acetyltransferase
MNTVLSGADRVVVTFEDLGEAEYTRGAEVETAAGDIVESGTASLEIISVAANARGERIGTRLLAETIGHMHQEGFTHLRAQTTNPLMVRMMERAVREKLLRRTAYRPITADDAFSAPSSAFLDDPRVVPPAAAMSLADRTLVECVAEL